MSSSEHQSLLGYTQHATVMANLNITTQPGQMSVHERFHVGGEVDLAPTTGSQNTVKLSFADDKVVFTVHSQLLCYYSPYFNDILDRGGVTSKARVRSKMLRREWRWENESDLETMEGTGYGDKEEKVQVDVRIKLPGDPVRHIILNKDEIGDVCPRAVAAFVDWLYKGFAGFTYDDVPHIKYSSTELIKLWVFAGKIGVPACQNDCIEGIELVRRHTNVVNTRIIGWVYENTKGMEGGDKLKRLLLDQCSWKLDGLWILAGGLNDESSIPREAVVRLLGSVMALAQSNVNIMTAQPPFALLEWRKSLYWIEDNMKHN